MSEQTLQQALEQFHEADLREPHLVLWQLLNRFVAVCNAVTHAHSKGIVHGDIRPENIVLGPYGQTQVVGWGPQTGDVIRTPIYMSPEQAERRGELVGPASDVYSLGATLYALLTGEAPFPGKQVDEVLNSIKRGQFLWPRQKKNDVARALEKICLKAMARQPEKRYATASELAADVEYWLADESASAYCRPWTRKGRWGRHHRRVLAGAAALLLTALGAFSISTVWIRQHEQAVQSARAQADRNLRLAHEVVDKTVTTVTASPSLAKADFHQLRYELLKSMLPFYEQLLMQRQDDYELKAERGRALQAFTLLSVEIGKNQAARFDYLFRARSDYELVCAIFSQLAADFPTVFPYRQELVNSMTGLANLLHEMRQRGDFVKRSQVEAAYRDAVRIQAQLATDFPNVPQYRQELATSFYNLSKLLSDENKHGEAKAAYRDALKIQTKLAADFPAIPQYRQELGTSLHNLANLLLYELRKHSRFDEPDDARAAYREAEATFRDALKIQTQLAADFPAVPQYRQELANSLYNLAILLQGHYSRLKGRDEAEAAYREAEAAFRDALKIQTQLIADFPTAPRYRQELARSDNSLGNVLRILGKHDDAEAVYREALRIRAQLAADFPAVPDYHHDLTETLFDLTSFVVRSRNWPRLSSRHVELAEARKLLEQAVAHDKPALLADPRNPAFRAYFRANRQVLASTLLDLGDHTAAAAAAEELIRAAVESASDSYRGACILAGCVPLAKRDSRLSEAERQERARSYADRALAALQHAVHSGYKNAEFMQTDGELESLWSRAEFRKLVAEIEEKRATPAK